VSSEAQPGWRLGQARPLVTRHGEFALAEAQHETTGEVAWLLTRGDVATPEPLLARVHSSCVTSETFRGCDCDCADQLAAALERIAACGRGALFYLFQERRFRKQHKPERLSDLNLAITGTGLQLSGRF
jgi:GTP cyclohydrolase II